MTDSGENEDLKRFEAEQRKWNATMKKNLRKSLESQAKTAERRAAECKARIGRAKASIKALEDTIEGLDEFIEDVENTRYEQNQKAKGLKKLLNYKVKTLSYSESTTVEDGCSTTVYRLGDDGYEALYSTESQSEAKAIIGMLGYEQPEDSKWCSASGGGGSSTVHWKLKSVNTTKKEKDNG